MDPADEVKDIPLALAKTKGKKKKVASESSKGKAKAKVAPKSKKAAATKKKAERQTSSPEAEEDSEDGEVENPFRNRLVFEGDPDFEEAFQASRRARRAAQEARRPRRSTPQPVPGNPNPTLAVPGRSSQASAPPAHLAPRPAAAPHQNYNPRTGLPFVGPYRRPHALSPYGEYQPRRRGSPMREITFAPSASPRLDITGRPITVRTSDPPARNFFTTATPADRPRPNVYAPAPDGSHRHYSDNSGTPAFVRYPPLLPSNSRVAFTPNQRAEAQLQAQAQNMAFSHSQAESTQQQVSPLFSLSSN